MPSRDGRRLPEAIASRLPGHSTWQTLGSPCVAAFRLPAAGMTVAVKLGTGNAALAMDVHDLGDFRAGWRMLEAIAGPQLAENGIDFTTVEGYIIAGLARAARDGRDRP